MEQQRLALQLHFSRVPAWLAFGLFQRAKEQCRAGLRRLSFADWRWATEQCREQTDLRPEPNWGHWQHSLAKAEELAQSCYSDSGIIADTLLVYGTEAYPKSLYRLYRPPFVLFARGDTGLFTRHTWQKVSGFAVCGSRKATLQGRSDAYTLAYGVALAGDFYLISGLSEGIELAACEGALAGSLTKASTEATELQAGKKSAALIGVLCCGLDAMAPLESRQMGGRILAAGGLLLSEYPASQPRQHYTFLQRNRILAALAASLIMVELGTKTKALNLVDYALELNHDVAALGNSAGVQRLCEQGCCHWPDAVALLRDLGMEYRLEEDVHKCEQSSTGEIGRLVAESVHEELSCRGPHFLGRRIVGPAAEKNRAEATGLAGAIPSVSPKPENPEKSDKPEEEGSAPF
ncbi:DNA-processing protein DprA [Candidatus Haliotispira prima]|uniref:DNA-processing protein DprA n=1 Tax=Candidatus Haliotispira prima TaxID=3034016 RepID=A0ABY8MHC7_9SPIO|nr:DNA-processing protein DprA [Candidatus Haliotispira prima]